MTALTTTPAFADAAKIDELIVATTVPDPQRDAAIKAATAFYRFWSTGDKALLEAALALNFVDRALPPGRRQGPAGAAFASEHFRAAVPDLRVEVLKIIVADEYLTVHMVFQGHFTGLFGKA